MIVSGRRVLTPDGVRPASLVIEDGRIAAVDEYAPGDGPRDHDAGDDVILPGLVDPHVHVNEPGRTDWEGFETATRAAAAGGVTTIVDMPLNSTPVTTTGAALSDKANAANGQCRVDYGFWGGVVPGNETELLDLHESGVLGFKCFLVDSGLDDFPAVTEADLLRALPRLREMRSPLAVHAESPGPIEAAARAHGKRSSRRYADYLRSRPPESELEAIDLMIGLGARTRGMIHIVHVSAAEALKRIAAARKEGIALTAETCPHYLSIRAEDVPDGATVFKCAPPVRGSANRERLWRGLEEGTLDFIASDHSPCPAAGKCLDTGDFFAAWGGISSLGLTLPVVWTGMLERGLSLEQLGAWLAEGPAELVGLGNRKGRIAPGFDADLVSFDPDKERALTEDSIHFRHRHSPYLGRRFRGRVRKTWVRGTVVHEDGEFPGAPIGQWLRRAS